MNKKKRGDSQSRERVLHEENMRYTLLKNESTGAFYLDAACTHSAVWFSVRVGLRPGHVAELFSKRKPGKLTVLGKHKLKRLADRIQGNPGRFGGFGAFNGTMADL